MLLAFVLLGAGGALLSAGAELFAEHVVGAARRVGLTTVGLALLLAGAEPEEAVVASLGLARDRPDLAVVDVLGANVVIATLTLSLLGAAVLVALVCAGLFLWPAPVLAATPGRCWCLPTVPGSRLCSPEPAYQGLGRLEWPQPA